MDCVTQNNTMIKQAAPRLGAAQGVASCEANGNGGGGGRRRRNCTS